MSTVCEIRKGQKKEIFRGSPQKAIQKYKELVSKRRSAELYYRGTLLRKSGR